LGNCWNSASWLYGMKLLWCTATCSKRSIDRFEKWLATKIKSLGEFPLISDKSCRSLNVAGEHKSCVHHWRDRTYGVSFNSMVLPWICQSFSADSIADDDNSSEYTTEFLNSLNVSGLPPHKLILKKNAPIILLRNLNPRIGACNGTRLNVDNFSKNLISATILGGDHAEQKVLIPRFTLSPTADMFPFTRRRRQFPVRLAFAMTINKSQGQTFRKVGVFLPHHVFTHGQLYVAFSKLGRGKTSPSLCSTIKRLDMGKLARSISLETSSSKKYWNELRWLSGCVVCENSFVIYYTR
jgi:ATP-dependent DNA helicase PIF1